MTVKGKLVPVYIIYQAYEPQFYASLADFRAEWCGEPDEIWHVTRDSMLALCYGLPGEPIDQDRLDALTALDQYECEVQSLRAELKHAETELKRRKAEYQRLYGEG